MYPTHSVAIAIQPYGDRHTANDNFLYEGSDATTIELHINEITMAAIQSAYPPYSGTNLILAYIPKVVWLL